MLHLDLYYQHTIQGATGSVTSGPYTANATESWALLGDSAANRIELTFSYFDVECDHDLVVVYLINGSVWQPGEQPSANRKC